MKRREFIQLGMVLGATSVIPSWAHVVPGKIGLQLYTLRDIIGKDPKGVLKQVADLGYQELETFGYREGMLFGMTVKDFGVYVSSLGMKITSGHYGMGMSERTKTMKGSLSNDWERAVADAKEMGQEYMIIAFLMPEERASIDNYKRVCEMINKGGEVCKQYGLKIGYHNHDFEFVELEGQIPFHLMMKELDPKLVSMELDLYWATFSGNNPIDLFAKYPGRFEQWHLKDMDKADRKKNPFLGTGSIDFRKIYASAKLSGMKHAYVEHDTFPASSIETVTADIASVKGW